MFRITLLLLLLAGSVSGQNTPVASAPASPEPALAAMPAAARTAADTVRAIHRLYAKRRRVGNMLTLGAVGADLALAGISSANEGTGRSSGSSGFGIPGNGRPLIQIGFGGFALIYGVVAVPIMGVGIQQLIAYGPKREAKVLARYEAQRQLPAKIRRQLRRHLR